MMIVRSIVYWLYQKNKDILSLIIDKNLSLKEVVFIDIVIVWCVTMVILFAQ